MTTKNTIILSLAFIAVALVAGLLLWNYLPDFMASHWNAADEVDGYMPKAQGVLLMPLIALGVLALLIVLPAMDPLKENVARFRGIFNSFILFITLFMLYGHFLILAWSLGFRFKMSSVMFPFIGILFIVVGLMLKQAKRNFFIGIRTPWTLSSDMVWEKTHRVGSWLFITSGVFAIVGGLFGGMTAFWSILAPLVLSTIFLTIYSYTLYLDEKGK